MWLNDPTVQRFLRWWYGRRLRGVQARIRMVEQELEWLEHERARLQRLSYRAEALNVGAG